MAKTEDERLKEIDVKMNKLKSQKKKILATKSKKARNARTKRLVEIGALVEKALDIECDENLKNIIFQCIAANKENIIDKYKNQNYKQEL